MFTNIKSAVQRRFSELSKSDLYAVKVDKDELFNAYIASLPEEERASHICNCCRSFLNQYGNIVSIKDDKISTMWDFETAAPYAAVPKALGDIVRSKAIAHNFLSTFEKLGTDFNHQRLENGEVIRWDHFFIALPKAMVHRSSASIESVQGSMRTTKEVFQRSLETITTEAVDTVLDLISQNILYRGKEFEAMLKTFSKLKKKYDSIDEQKKDVFAWNNFKEGGRVRNTAIGTLLINLSEGMALENAVRAFETMVAPANYKRPTALVTEKMVQQAQDKIAELGLQHSLHRRHATKEDIPLSNLLFVNRIDQAASVFDQMKAEVPVNPKSFNKAKEVSLDEFIANILPTATSVDLLLENNSSFMSLIAPSDVDAPNMFPWDNKISWTYQNNMTDAIKEKVKQAGGSVSGELRISLEWFNYDDLDLHVIEPNGNEIYFGNRRSAKSGGFLDVDMNAGGGRTREAVENITFEDRNRMMEGNYQVIVHNFAKRENIDVGFNVQIECQGNVIDLSQTKVAADRKRNAVATFNYSRSRGIYDFKTALSESTSQKEVNEVLTNRFQQVNMITYSPNHWTNAIGNKHLFFIIDKAKVDTPLRPFFNEYLKPELNEHRKVFEILGSKLMVTPEDNQLTGVGFSLTQKTQFIARVNNAVFKVNI